MNPLDGLTWAQRFAWNNLQLARRVYAHAFRFAIDAGIPEDVLAAEFCDMALTTGAMLKPYEVEL